MFHFLVCISLFLHVALLVPSASHIFYHNEAWDPGAALVSSVANGENVTRILIAESLWGRVDLFYFSSFSFQHAALVSANCR